MLEDFTAELIDAGPFQIISAWELRTYMTDVLLRDSDVMSMTQSLELRVPFVDRVLLEWLWAQPDHFKYDPRVGKRALADATADLVPAAIRNRRKQGFTLPFALWMRKELRPFIEQSFSPAALAACPWLEPVAVRKVWDDFFVKGDTRAWSRAWALAVLVAFANRKETA
jgi:asparagine synthase (glutamine-hydrolysing)